MVKVMNVDGLIADFLRVTELVEIDIPHEMVEYNTLPAPHTPPTILPADKLAVYIFMWGDRCLKVGKVGSKSKARFTSQHYSPGSSRSNLAKSILKRKEELGLFDIDESNIGSWIKNNTDRINILLDANLGIHILSLLESFLHCRLNPLFEGFESQRRL